MSINKNELNNKANGNPKTKEITNLLYPDNRLPFTLIFVINPMIKDVINQNINSLIIMYQLLNFTLPHSLHQHYIYHKPY